ncbi:hypothetical protein A0256_14330 [Mucilaginibacter sp. PAMC 26640]|nr:hypothetical protein A0256_14330 [Mucilaginibacter sp. PAMC 26640]
MSYKIFISFTEEDKALAILLDKFLNNQYGGKVHTSFSKLDVKFGEDWKKWIRTQATECDAIVVLLTKNSLKKPWIYIEWAAFWYNDRESLVLKTDEVGINEMINPMLSKQFGDITDEEMFNSFISRIQELCGADRIPYRAVPQFLTDARAAIEEQKVSGLNKLAAEIEKSLSAIPADDAEKKKIAESLLKGGKKGAALQRIITSIGSPGVKSDLIAGAIQSRDSDLLSMLSFPDDNEIIWKSAIQLLNAGFQDLESFKTMIDLWTPVNNIGLRNIGIALVKLNMEDSELFRYILSRFENLSVLVAIAEAMINADKVSNDYFKAVWRKMVPSNGSPARVVGGKLISAGYDNEGDFMPLYKALIDAKKCKPAAHLLNQLREKSSNIYKYAAECYQKNCGELPDPTFKMGEE